MKHIIIVITITLTLASTVFCFITTEKRYNDDDYKDSSHILQTQKEDGLQIVVSIYPLFYLVERITKNTSDTVLNIGNNKDPHDFQLSAKDIQSMIDADLVILQGADLEPWGHDMQETLEHEATPLLIASAYVLLHEMGEDDHSDHDDHDEHEDSEDEHHHAHGTHDPHTWLDPVLMSQVAEAIAQKLSIINPQQKETYANNLANLQNDLALLDTQYNNTLSSCTLNQVIASHDAFGYISRRYNFSIHNISGLSTQDQPSALTLLKLKKEAQEGFGAILLEENSIKSYGETLAQETNLQTLPINSIVSNIPNGKNYLDIMQTNLVSLKTALKCN